MYGNNSLKKLTLKKLLPAELEKIPDSRTFYDDLAEKLEKRCKNMGTGSNGFKYRQHEIITAAPDVRLMLNVISRQAYIRPLIDLWLNPRYYKIVPFSGKLLEHIEKLALSSRKKRMGRLALRELCLLFFSRYDLLPDMHSLCILLKRELDKYSRHELLFGLDSLVEYKDLFIQEKGHEQLAKLAQKNSSQLPDEARANGISTDTRFFQASTCYHYINLLNNLGTNENNLLLLEELQKPKIHDLSISGNKRLGHYVMIILMDKLRKANCYPSDPWRNTLLGIAGDPRMPKTTKKYRDWWAQIDASYADLMTHWLAVVDMELFLDILAVYTRNGTPQQQRMYPARGRLLERIFNLRLVKTTRLFLGEDVKAYVERQCRGATTYSVTIRNNPNLAVFYLNLGSAHVIEGTHNFKIKIFEKMPSSSPLLNDALYEIDRRELGESLKERYYHDFGDEGYFETTHYHSGSWKKEVILQMRRLGFRI